MERDCDICLFTVVPRSRFKTLLASGRYIRRNRGILVGVEKFVDGREDFIVLDKEWALWEKVEREVLGEIQRVADDELIEVIDSVVAPSSAPVDSIPDADKQAALKLGLGENQPLPEHPPSGRRTSWFRESFDPFGGR